jgi:ferredoxin-NADP reductase
MVAPAETHAHPASGRKAVKEMEVMVAHAIRETPDTTTLVLFTGNDSLEYKAGHFLTIEPQQFPELERWIAYLEDLKGKREPARAYSMCSEPHEKHVAVTIKEERYISGQTRYPPLMSPMLVHRTPRGAQMVITGFTGPYVLPDDIESQTDHVVHVCAGSGIVPDFSIIKYSLREHPRVRHTLVYSNKTYEDIIFRDALAEMERAHPGRLRVLHTLTREDRTGFRRGRIGADLLREAIPDPTAAMVYACGPGIGKHEREAARAKGEEPAPRFLETTVGLLAEVGVPKKNIRRESYG